MIVSYKIRIYPNKTQIKMCNNMFGACRFVYNKYLEYNIQRHDDGKKFVSWREYRKIIKEMREGEYPWLKELNKHSLDESVKTCNLAFKRFFEKKAGFPKFKSKKHPIQSFYLDQINNREIFFNKRIRIPYLGKVRITETDYVPRDRHMYGMSILKEIDKYYVIFRMGVDEEDLDKSKYDNVCKGYGYGIDVGIDKYLTISDNYYNTYIFKSFLNDKNILRLEEKVIRLQRIISNKREINYNKILNNYLLNHNESDLTDEYKNIMKGMSYSNKCKYVQKKINKLKKRITNIKEDNINKLVSNLVKNKPEYITIETLDIKDMLENDSSTTLHKHIQDSKFRYFFNKLSYKCHIYGIELRKSNKYFTSSKTCCMCGNKKKDLKLSDRIYKCDVCDNIVDRDINAAINLVDLKKYTIV